jgi:hypothetical protein
MKIEHTASRFTRLLAGIAGATSMLLAGLMPAAVQASDGKDYPATLCRPYTALTVPVTTFAEGSIFNGQSYGVSYICPGLRDEPGSISSAAVRFSTNSAASIYCVLYSTSPTGNYYYRAATSNVATGRRTLNLGSVAGHANGVYTIYCSIPSYATLHSFTLNEN